MVFALAVGAIALTAPLRATRWPTRTPARPTLSAAAAPASSYAPLVENAAEVWANFPRTWVPLASAYELDPERPTPVQFLGRSYVLWQENAGEWQAFADACPHRLAPLSEVLACT